MSKRVWVIFVYTHNTKLNYVAMLIVSRFWESISSHVHRRLLPASPFLFLYLQNILLESQIYHTSLSKMCQLVRASFFPLFSCVCCIQVSLKILIIPSTAAGKLYTLYQHLHAAILNDCQIFIPWISSNFQLFISWISRIHVRPTPQARLKRKINFSDIIKKLI